MGQVVFYNLPYLKPFNCRQTNDDNQTEMLVLDSNLTFDLQCMILGSCPSLPFPLNPHSKKRPCAKLWLVGGMDKYICPTPGFPGGHLLFMPSGWN